MKKRKTNKKQKIKYKLVPSNRAGTGLEAWDLIKTK